MSDKRAWFQSDLESSSVGKPIHSKCICQGVPEARSSSFRGASSIEPMISSVGRNDSPRVFRQ